MIKGSHHTPETKQKLKEAADRRRGITQEELDKHNKRRHIAALISNIKRREICRVLRQKTSL